MAKRESEARAIIPSMPDLTRLKPYNFTYKGEPLENFEWDFIVEHADEFSCEAGYLKDCVEFEEMLEEESL